MQWKMPRSVVLISIALLAMCGPALSDRESAFRGRRIAEANCAECHAIARYDTSENPAAPPFRTLSRRPSFATLRQSMSGQIFLRHAVMPDFEPTPDQVNDIVDFIENIQFPNP
ncbi:MAG: cytochrome c [Mesorhizobium sp.]|nr:cytochrome c [Mesorhizobium sp.]